MISINPLNNKKYKIPDKLDDKKHIDDFLKNNKNKKVVLVQGLGFVGSVMSLVCANSLSENYAVIGVDLPNESSYWKIKSINEGFFPIKSSDKKVDVFFKNARKKNNFYATYDNYSYSKADIIIININLDVQKNSNFYADIKNYDVDLNPFTNSIKIISKNCKEDVIILVESTVPPGTCQKLIYPIFKTEFKNRRLNLNKLKLGHSYERVMPGPDYINSIQNFYRVYSGIDKKSEKSIEKFLKTIISTDNYPLTKLSNTNATEMSKVLENSYRSMNIAFMVEWSRFAENANVNLYEVIDAIKMRPTHSNMMFPGIGVGGYCLTKDPLLASWSKKNIFKRNEGLSQSEKAVEINDKMPLEAFNFLKSEINLESIENLNILLLGVSYRSEVSDTRYTPVEQLYNYLSSENCKIKLHDPYVNFWEEKKIYIKDNIDKLFKDNFDVIVFCTSHNYYKNSKKLINLILSQKKLFILDTVGVLKNNEINILKTKFTVRVLGSGDIN
tara:strand:- start:88 stop:1587 length:1500 start_codon:yes stop_codon:yes gene_type:complete